MKKNIKGFTLVELLVVIAIIGLLSTLAVVSLNSARTKARDARRQSDLKQVSTAMELYNSENNAYPIGGACNANGILATQTSGLLCGSGNAIKDANNVYLNSIPQPPGTGAVPNNQYRYTGTGSTYCLSVALENTTNGAYWTCALGSCFYNGAGCY
jgi:prepilin-type N-terminal cleavage/methylation domain-containing protein